MAGTRRMPKVRTRRVRDSFRCDGVGYGKQNNNTSFSKLTGSAGDQLTGRPVNPMSEYGKNMGRIANGSNWHYPEDVTFAFYQAEHPWGPWSCVGEKSAMQFIDKPGRERIHRWYGPSLSPKFISENPDGSATAILLFSGQTWENTPSSLYKNNSCPVTFSIKTRCRDFTVSHSTARWTLPQAGTPSASSTARQTGSSALWTVSRFTRPVRRLRRRGTRLDRAATAEAQTKSGTPVRRLVPHKSSVGQSDSCSALLRLAAE